MNGNHTDDENVGCETYGCAWVVAVLMLCGTALLQNWTMLTLMSAVVISTFVALVLWLVSDLVAGWWRAWKARRGG